MCTFRGSELHNIENISYRSIGGLSPHPRAFHSVLTSLVCKEISLETKLPEKRNQSQETDLDKSGTLRWKP